MAVKLQMEGLAELRAALRNLPEHLTEEATGIVQKAATGAEQRIAQNYPLGPTGNLRRRVTTDHAGSRLTTTSRVRSRAPHANIFENGTRQRRNAKGANRGRMPEANENQKMVPVVIRQRRQMVEVLKDMVRREGFQVD
jgi:hypothetical protein